MSKKSALKNRIYSLEEIKNIVSAMKNMALMEIAKLNKFIATQDKVTNIIKTAASDFLTFHPYHFPLFNEKQIPMYIIIGSERGFCGNFNELVMDHFLETMKNDSRTNTIKPILIFVGHKITSKITQLQYTFESIDGPNAVEEIEAVILDLVNVIEKIDQKTKGKIHPGYAAIIYNEESHNRIQPTTTQPFHELLKQEKKAFSFPPLLSLKPNEFITEALNQYLFAILHQIFYQSFIAENRQRLSHMETAIQWLEKKTEKLILDYNFLHQEEITEEIEIILLSAKAVTSVNQ